MAVSGAAILSTLENWSPVFAAVDPADAARLPARWRPILLSPDGPTRCQLALDLWNQSFLELVPRFAGTFRDRLVDTRAYLADGVPVLVYVATADEGGYVSWVGYDPRTFGEQPPFWDAVPAPVQVFLREVHAGFTSGSGLGYGPLRPAHMEIFAHMADWPEGIPGWEDAAVASTRLLVIGMDEGLMYWCVSPDLGPGQVAVIYEGDVDPKDAGPELDELMMIGFSLA